MKKRALLRLFQLTFVATILFDLGSASSVCWQGITDNSSEAEQYHKVTQAIAQRNYSKALAQGRKLIDLTNKYGRVYSRIVRAAESASQLEEAKALFKSLLLMSPPNPRGDYGLGLIYSEQKDFATAIEHYKKCIDKQPEFPLPMLALVDAYRAAGKLDEAEKYIKLLINARPDSSVAHLGLGYCYARGDQADAAVMEFDLAQSLNPKMPDACYQKAWFQFYIGRRKDSFDTATRCLPDVQSEMDEDHMQAFLNVMAADQANLGNYSEAVSLFNQAIGLARKMEDKGYEEANLAYLALIHQQQDNYSQALLGYQKAFKVAKNSDSADSATNLKRYPGWFGSVYYSLGDLPMAYQYFQLGLEIARKENDEQLRTFLQSYIGKIFIDWNDIGQAIAHCKQVIEVDAKSSNPFLQSRAYNVLSALYLKTREYQKAGEAIQQALKLARDLDDFEQELEALNNLGEFHLCLSEMEKSIDSYQKALRLALTKTSMRHAWAACAGMAIAYGKLGQLDKAREHYQLAIDIMEKVRANLGSEEDRAGFYQDKIKVYKDLVTVLMQLHGKDTTKHYDAEAFHFAERGRARAFLDLLGEAKNVDQTIDPDLLERQQQNQTEISKLNVQLINERSKEPAKQDKMRIRELEEALGKADVERANWLRELWGRNPRSPDLKYHEPLTLEQAQRMLADHSLVLAYSLGEQESFLFAVSRDDYRVAKLPRSSDIGESVEKLITAMTAEAGASLEKYRAHAVKLHKELIQPAGELLEDKRELIIIADGALHQLPFETLINPSIAGAPTAVQSDYSKWPYLVSTFTISYAPSVTALASLRDYQKGTGAPQKDFVAFADPNYNKRYTPAFAALRSAGDGQQWKLPRLPYSRYEVEEIAKLFAKGQADLHLEDSASEENVKAKDRLSRYRIAHFSAHGLVNEKRPRLSGIVLSLPKADKEGNPLSEEDGLLSFYEILNLKLNADLVVLSACQTGMGKEIKGEGMMGLMRAFMYAGTPSVVVSLWNVNDRGAADLMIRFYKHLLRPGSERLNKAEALRKAQLEVIGLGSKPYYWAPFILVGKS